jgi:hypothetical protein
VGARVRNPGPVTRHHSKTILAALVVLWLAAAAAAFLAAAPAIAANEQKCSPTTAREIKLPRGADIRVTEQTCVITFPVGTDRAKYKAWVYTTWGPKGSGGIRPEQFEDYTVTARLEINRRGPDRVLGKRTCKIASVINRVASGAYTCQTNVEGNFGTARVWTGDGSVLYDVDGDGKGNFPRWQLHGSPRV